MTVCEDKKTVGQAALDILSKTQDPQSVIDTQQEMLKGYKDQLILAAKNGEKMFGRSKPIYVCVQTRRERLLVNVIRNQFYTRQTRPIPQYDLALYYYEPESEKLTFVWCIPDKETVFSIASNNFECPPGQEQLFGFVKSFLSGTLV